MSNLAIGLARNASNKSSEPANDAKGTAYAQGDVLLLRVDDIALRNQVTSSGPVVLAEGEVTGHRHAFYGGAVMFRDDALARAVPRELYIGHVKVGKTGALLEHGAGPGERGDHDPINIPPGTYIALRQREFTGTHEREFRHVAD
jgi:hypothetical protein